MVHTITRDRQTSQDLIFNNSFSSGRGSHPKDGAVPAAGRDKPDDQFSLFYLKVQSRNVIITTIVPPLLRSALIKLKFFLQASGRLEAIKRKGER